MIPDDEDYGRRITVQRRGREVRLTFVMSSLDKAKILQDELQHQLRTGVIFLALTGDAEAPK